MKQKIETIEQTQSFQQEIVRRNCANFKSFSFGGLLLSGLIVILGVLRGPRTLYLPQYMFFFVYLAALFALSRVFEKRQPRCIVALFYLALFPLYLVGILMGTVFDRDRPAITIMVLLCGLTLFILDKPWRLLLYIIGIGGLFGILAYFVKEPAAFGIDLINLEIFGGISLAINYSSLLERTESVKHYLLMRESQAQQESIIANLPTGIIVFRVQKGEISVVQVNPAVCRMLEIDPEKAMTIQGSDQVLMLTHPDDKERVMEAARLLMVPGAEAHYEFRNLNRAKNTYAWVSAEGKSIAQPDGSVLVYVGYADINARKEKEEEYQRHISALTEMDDENLIAKGQHNLTRNRVVFFTPKMGYSAKVQGGTSYDEAVEALADVAVTPRQRSKIVLCTGREVLLDRFRRGETDGSVEFKRWGSEGETLFTVLRYTLFEEPDTGDIIAFMYSYDVTERVIERKIVSKLGNMEYDLFGLIDLRTKKYTLLSDLSHTAQRMLQRVGDFDEMAGRRVERGVIPAEREEVRRAITVDAVVRGLEEKNIYSIMYSVQDEDGALRRKRFQFTYLDENKETIMFFRSDITEMYEKEQAQFAKIESALKAAEIASGAKTEFFSRMSHDMRTPMNGILGLAGLSQDENDPAVLKANIAKIGESGQYLLGLINDTLDFQRIESGRLTLEPQPVRASEVVENIIDMVRQTAEAKGVTLLTTKNEFDLDSYISVDPLRIKQIFVNLLSNAIKFTPAGGTVEFAMRLLSREGKVSHDEIIVRDTGIGMSEEFLRDRIFKPFSQESNQVTAHYAGSGLGLSIAKSLVEMMGGTIEVQSELGVGSTFTVRMDFQRVDDAEVRTKTRTDAERTQNVRAKLEGRQILLAEDHPLNAEIATRLLQKVGCVVTWVKDGQECVTTLENAEPGRFNLVLMDIRMPVMDGLAAARAIRAFPKAEIAKLPIIAMTANAYESDVKQSKEAGMNAHLSKPIEPVKLYETIAGVLEQS